MCVMVMDAVESIFADGITKDKLENTLFREHII
jgi:hypothetical protein